jgi:hypothetical protein
MELKETVKMMNSPNYKERFKAEVYQLDIRIGKLSNLLSAWDAGELKFQPTCPYVLLETQLNSMKVYRHLLQMRAEIEGIELYDENKTCKNCVHANKVDDITYECDAEVYDIDTLSCFIPKEQAQ